MKEVPHTSYLHLGTAQFMMSVLIDWITEGLSEEGYKINKRKSEKR